MSICLESNEGELEFHSNPINTTMNATPAPTCSNTDRSAPTCSTTDSFALGSVATTPGFSTNNFVLGSIGSLVGDDLYTAGSTASHQIQGEYNQNVLSDLSELTIGILSSVTTDPFRLFKNQLLVLFQIWGSSIFVNTDFNST